jgi:hypothetical protein
VQGAAQASTSLEIVDAVVICDSLKVLVALLHRLLNHTAALVLPALMIAACTAHEGGTCYDRAPRGTATTKEARVT